MVSYYNTMSYPTKHSAANLAYTAGQPWQWAANYHPGPSHQYIGEMDSSHATHHQMYYNPHMFHPATNATAGSDWHSPSIAENFSQNAEMLTQNQLVNGSSGVNGVNGSAPPGSSGSSSSTTTTAPITGSSQLNHAGSNIENQHQRQQQHSSHITEGLPSPPITVSGSEISSPDVPPPSLSPHQMAQRVTNNNNSPSSINNNNSAAINNNHRGSPLTTYPTFEWMKKTTTYQAQPAPGNYIEAELCSSPNLDEFSDLLDPSGKTRTKDKYRVVYTDCQRLELEKEYCSSRYITIRRKTELARVLSLSERQVKIWFQNRRAKERKQNKKVNEPSLGAVQHPDYGNIMDTKPKLEPSLHLQHPLHSLNPMAMGMPGMRLHHHLHGHAIAAHTHQLHQSSHAQISAAAVSSVGSIPM